MQILVVVADIGHDIAAIEEYTMTEWRRPKKECKRLLKLTLG